MLHVQIHTYDESDDTFIAFVREPQQTNSFAISIPAITMPYLAPGLCDITEDLPHGLIGQCFDLKRPGE